MSDEADETRHRWGKLLSATQLYAPTTPEFSAAQYWEAQAEMWHENYKGLMAIEAEHRRFKEALERIAAGANGPRSQVIAKKALGGGDD